MGGFFLFLFDLGKSKICCERGAAVALLFAIHLYIHSRISIGSFGKSYDWLIDWLVGFYQTEYFQRWLSYVVEMPSAPLIISLQPPSHNLIALFSIPALRLPGNLQRRNLSRMYADNRTNTSVLKKKLLPELIRSGAPLGFENHHP